ncbi:MAG: 16S rRNA (uracil(1498)-N(3))-methyltransferase [Gammaproteobacteria bacterium CG_4_10_14_0_8_um_filter_38_16]|nr:MAG: 16S rRNA (uracil(1498)-N(3))-methyltransferase [Gammaproteobacteria bacterium CG_4_10_14_0_8_um_filter_38_16]PJA03947.1 MAG: 16S rRNA (uracil(1498)-N(3))-methyltransferase [Gammaproteobacteria bacterium CG_4_10_14_0_2_um_filter_38_22]PJB09726.1 MAG: 16S rRNA (uracil(1498)-N(3))-methyltransferase [Gammaproteobacteria bacterium CG_4_9_14_3_um_filter_38_9]
MRRIRIYHQGELASGITLMLDQNASHHLLQVLRKKAGERFWVFNGGGGEFEATLISANKKTACIELGEFYLRKTESPLSIHLAQGISRGERMDYALQKAAELGVAEITPLFTEFCQVQLSDNRIEKRVAHWQSIAVSAAEQSGRCAVPIVHPPVLFSEWLQKNNNEIKLICCPRQNENLFPTIKTIPKNITVAIGAEGGFSDREITSALQAQFLTFSLGPRVLRTETAAVVALTLLQQKFGDFKE